MATDRELVDATLDWLGIESGELSIRLAVLRGLGLAFGVRTRRTPTVPTAFIVSNVEPPFPEPLEGQPSDPLFPHREPPAGLSTAAPLEQALAEVHEPDPRNIVKATKADEKAAAQAARAENHDPSWREERIRKGFFAALAELTPPITDKYDVIAAFCEARGLPRPSRMTAVQRDRWLGNLKDSEKRLVFDEWVGRHAADEEIPF